MYLRKSCVGNTLYCNAFSKYIMYHYVQEVLFPGEDGLMFRGYRPVINTLAKGLDICLNHRYVYECFSYNLF
jgi:hypothetical protein